MFATIIGPVDMYSAAVLCIFAITICISITTYIGKYRRRIEIDQDFELSKMRIKDEKDIKVLSLNNNFTIEEKKLSQNLITSHRENRYSEDG